MKLSKLKLHDGISFTQSQLSQTVFTSEHYDITALDNGWVQVKDKKSGKLSVVPNDGVQYGIPFAEWFAKAK